MPILTQDIKLLKSAVMADTPDGGGQMTGLPVIDGQSNNLFPDTSSVDRAVGRVQARKVFGVAHSADTDALLGANAILVDAPNDPLVHCALFKTSGWADTRQSAKDVIERMLVKGPKMAARIYDTHYAGSRVVRLYQFAGDDFPKPGDSIVLRNPNGGELYVRVIKVTVQEQDVALSEGSGVVARAKIATVDLAVPLAMDVYGPPVTRVFNQGETGPESSYARLYSTSLASGAQFYGIKPLGVAASIGDLSIKTAGGIYTPLVPAATLEEPIADQTPSPARAGVFDGSYAKATLSAVTCTLAPGAVLHTPTPITPGSYTLTVNATTYTDSGNGVLKLNSTDVGVIDYAGGTITLGSAFPSLGSVFAATGYKPAAVLGTATHSASLKITTANQGLGFTTTLAPAPAMGTVKLEYMAQGRWYTLQDDYKGKLAGADSAYGVGTVDYTTGSIAITLGAIPDVDSYLLVSWGDKNAAVKVDIATLPTKLRTDIAVPGASVVGLSVTWAHGATSYTATTATTANTGALTGDATGQLAGGGLQFAPGVFPDGSVTVSYTQYPTHHTEFSGSGGSFTLASLPGDNTFSADLSVTIPADLEYLGASGAATLSVVAYGSSLIVSSVSAPALAKLVGQYVGTINTGTGAVTFSANATFVEREYVTRSWTIFGGMGSYTALEDANQTVSLSGALSNVVYYSGTGSLQSLTVTPALWTAAIPAAAQPDSLVFGMGSDLYTVAGGILRKGFNASTGAVTPAGTYGTSLAMTLTPAGGAANALTWYGATSNASVPSIKSGVFRTITAPLKVGVLQLSDGTHNASADEAGVLSGGGFTGTVDFIRGVVRWTNSADINPAALRYNAVTLSYLPLDAALLGLDTSRLPLDGKVPIYRNGDLVVIHHTLSTPLPNPLVKGTAYDLGRVRIASVRVKDALGAVVPDTLYTTDLDAGTLTVPVPSNITPYTQPLTVEHRIEDMLLCASADVSGALKLTRSLTHDYPANTSFVSSVLPFGDLFARAYNYIEQVTWTGVWSDERIGAAITAQYNSTQYPIEVTNAGAIRERWALVFTNTTAYRVIGESVGEIATGNTATLCAPVNPATGVPYFAINPLGFGSGWSQGNVLRFNTDACGAPFWAVRTVLQGPATLASDKFAIAFRGDVDRP